MHILNSILSNRSKYRKKSTSNNVRPISETRDNVWEVILKTKVVIIGNSFKEFPFSFSEELIYYSIKFIIFTLNYFKLP